ncbi:MAG: hypothetical protein NTX97_08840 [Bacteroidetes bacterium]|nr:hypothetical protein [Bacteroidota bacterium]
MNFSKVYKIFILVFLFQVSKSFAQDTLNPSIIEQKSYQLYLDKNWTELISFGNKAIYKDYDYFYLRMRVGIAYFEKKNYCLAEVHFKKALALNSSDELAQEYLYFCYLFMGRVEESRKLSKNFSPELANKIGTNKLSSIGFVNLEGGTKINNSSNFLDSSTNISHNYFSPANFFQLSLTHFVKNNFSLLHAASYYQQQYYSAIPGLINPQIYGSNSIKQMQYYLMANIPAKNDWMISPSIHFINYKKTPDTSPSAKAEQKLTQEQQALIQQLQPQQQTLTQQQQQLTQQQQLLQQQAANDQIQINQLLALPQPLPPMQHDQLVFLQGDLYNIQQQLNGIQQQLINIQQQLTNNQQQIDAYNDPIKKAQEGQKLTPTSKNYFVASISIQKRIKKLALTIGTTVSNFDNTTQLNHFGSISFSALGNSKLVLGGTGYFHSNDIYKTTYSSFSPFIYTEPINRLSLTACYLLNNGQNIMENNGALINNSADLTTSKLSVIANINLNKHFSFYSLYQREDKTEMVQKFDYHYNTFLVGIKIIP